MSTKDPGLCAVRWCGEVLDHDGPHRKTLFDHFGMDVESGRPAILQLNLQGESTRVRALVLVTGSREVGLTWPMTRELVNALELADRQYYNRDEGDSS